MAPTDFLSYLDDCVNTTEECSTSLNRTTQNLHPGVIDLPRLTKVLKNVHHYLVLPQPTISAHKATLSQHLAPQIDSLISKAENGISASDDRIQRMEERLSILNSAKVPYTAPPPTIQSETEESDDEGTDSRLGDINEKELNPAQRRRVIMLRGKRKRLEAEMRKLRGEDD